MSEMLFREECLREGSQGLDVYVLQIMLCIFFEGCEPRLVPNGIYGRETTRAVKRLQNELLNMAGGGTGEFDRNTITVFGHEFGCDLASIPAYDPTITGS